MTSIDFKKQQYQEAGCTENEIQAVTIPLKQLIGIENGVALAVSAKDKLADYVRSTLNPQFLAQNPNSILNHAS